MKEYITATDAVTGMITRPLRGVAFKERKYYCPDCPADDNEVIFCAENSLVVTPYFRHNFKNKTNPCRRYTKPSAKTIHDEAIKVLKIMLEDRTSTIVINQKCKLYGNECGFMTENEMPQLTIHDEIVIEAQFRLRTGTDGEVSRKADIGWFRSGKLFKIFEVRYSHATDECDRPDPWYEIEAEDILKCEKNTEGEYVFNCCRNARRADCPDCLLKQQREQASAQRLKENQIRWAREKQEKEEEAEGIRIMNAQLEWQNHIEDTNNKKIEDEKRKAKQAEIDERIYQQMLIYNKEKAEQIKIDNERRRLEEEAEHERQYLAEQRKRKFKEQVENECCERCNYIKVEETWIQIHCGYCCKTYKRGDDKSLIIVNDVWVH
jgi:hypothetical protein